MRIRSVQAAVNLPVEAVLARVAARRRPVVLDSVGTRAPEGRFTIAAFDPVMTVEWGLHGVTRAAVLELAGQLGIPAEEWPRTIRDLRQADGVFLTNAIMEVIPVTRVERKAIAGERPGPLTQRPAWAYRELVLSTAADC
ncbi:MAG: aminotransferase class IV [Phycisphaerae bacterium]|nr:aminotransferase class IV [Phycisphaerae bacterium]